MDLRDIESPLSDYSDFGDELASLMAKELDESSHRMTSTDSRAAPPLSLTKAIEDYLGNLASRDESEPAEVGMLQGYQRKSVISSALALAIARAVRHCTRKTALTAACLYYVAIRSDNSNGRCTDSAARIADYLGCAEDVVRDVRDALVDCGALREEKRRGQPNAVWLPYVEEVFLHSDFALLAAIAPARLGPGRPRKRENGLEKTPGARYPTFLPKPRVSAKITPGLRPENPGFLAPDCKNSSLQDLISRKEGHTRFRPETPNASRINSNEGSEAGSRPKSGADHLWDALDGQAFNQSFGFNRVAIRNAFAECPHIVSLSKMEAQTIAALAGNEIPADAMGRKSWPTTAVLSAVIADERRYRNQYDKFNAEHAAAQKKPLAPYDQKFKWPKMPDKPTRR
ncbi:hypothetical protein [Hyphomicrobium sp. ghe19]|uniref:hypothetical protein n=1 Tax=Hyphomicrobium sp. ghe19 TaxID=2682968 RepID=UPI0030CF9829